MKKKTIGIVIFILLILIIIILGIIFIPKWKGKNNDMNEIKENINNKDTSFDLACTVIDEKDNYLKSFEVNQLEARVSLISDIEDIAKISKQGVTTKSIRKTRSKEKAKERRVI